MKTLRHILNFIFSALFNALNGLLKFLFEPETKANNAFLMNNNEVLSSFNYGFRIGDKALTLEASTKHMICYGPSGSGKTSIFIANSLLSIKNASMVLRDPSGELYNKFSGYLASAGFAVRVVNFSSSSSSSDGYNPLAGELSDGDITRIAKLVITTSFGSGNGDNSFWNLSAEEVAFILIKVLKEQEPRFHNFYNLKLIVEAFSADPTSLDYLFSKSKDEDLLSMYKALIAIPERTRLNSVATLKATMNPFSDKDLVQTTSRTTFSMEQLRQQPTVLFVQSNVLDDAYLNLIQSLFFSDLLRHLMDRIPTKTELPVYLLIDEASSLTLPGILETSILNLRKYKACLGLAVQSPQSFERAYGKKSAEIIQANAFAKLYLPGIDLETATHLERLLGRVEITDDKERTKIVPVMDSFSIRTLKDKAVLLCGNKPATLVPLRPYYKIYRFKQRSQIAPIPIIPVVTKYDLGDVPRIDLSAPNQAKQDETK
jgi:type IV secretion system protein VirD4